ncbi:MAG: type II toxin-antitoxin system RelE/ParE family toxin [Elusimicrobia bacterium]|nr:type II toxin-antitoxin system RelE/ParE family toxin [Elusimicrobiota bacterium]
MLKNIFYFSDERGRCPVMEFIHSLPPDEQAKVYSYIRELRIQGHNLRRPMADYVTQGLYELRPKANRIFYFFYLKESAVFVHAIRKKTDKLPERDIRLALKRKANMQSFRDAGKLLTEDL